MPRLLLAAAAAAAAAACPASPVSRSPCYASGADVLVSKQTTAQSLQGQALNQKKGKRSFKKDQGPK